MYVFPSRSNCEFKTKINSKSIRDNLKNEDNTKQLRNCIRLEYYNEKIHGVVNNSENELEHALNVYFSTSIHASKHKHI